MVWKLGRMNISLYVTSVDPRERVSNWISIFLLFQITFFFVQFPVYDISVATLMGILTQCTLQ